MSRHPTSAPLQVATEATAPPADRCPHCSDHPVLEPERGTGYLCRSCGYVQESQLYTFADNWKDSRQEWIGANILGAVSSLKSRSGRTIDGSGLGVDTGKTAVRRRQTVQTLLDFIMFLCSSPTALHNPRYRIRAQELFRISRIDARKCRSMGETAKYVAAACVMLSVREKKSRVSTREMAVWADLEEEKLAKEFRKTANQLDLNRYLGTDIEEHVDNVLVYLKRLSEDPDAHRLKGDTPFTDLTKAFLSLIFPRLTELRSYILSVSAFTDRIGVYVNRLGTSHIVAIVFGAMEGMTRHHLHRANRVFEELTTLLHCSAFGARERYRELVAVVRDLADCLPLLSKKVEIPALLGAAKHISAAESFHFSQTLSSVVENTDELLEVRFGGNAVDLQKYVTSVDQPTALSTATSSPSAPATPSKRTGQIPPTPSLVDAVVESSAEDEDGSREGGPRKRRRIAHSISVEGKSTTFSLNTQDDDNEEDGEEWAERKTECGTDRSVQPSRADETYSTAALGLPATTPPLTAVVQPTYTGKWPGPGSCPPGEGWVSMLQWPDSRVEVAPPALALPKRIKKLRKRTAGLAMNDQSKSGLLRSVYERHRPSDLKRARKRRQPRPVLELLGRWQEENRGNTTLLEREDDGSELNETQQLLALLLQGVRPIDLPLHLLPQSTVAAKAVLQGRSLDGYATDELFEEGELDDCFRSAEEKEIALRMWCADGLDEAHAKMKKAASTRLASKAKSPKGRRTTKFKKPNSKSKEVEALLHQPDGVMSFLDGQERDALEVALEELDTAAVREDENSENSGTDDGEEDTFEEI